MSETMTVVCVHGLWMPGSVMLLVKRRLQTNYRYRVHLFSYRSHRCSLDDNARALAGFLEQKKFDGVHLVGHSLGGVVALRMLALVPDAPVARVVCLGSPLCGSRVASRLGRKTWGRRILGRTVTAGVVEAAASQWAAPVCVSREVGVVAGTVPAGMGRLVTTFDEANDGTIAVSDTRLAGLKDHICMQVTHTGLVFSRDVADQVAAFLRRGEFLHNA
jgi:pimeloyl-ACP methyl ester carboxylesterase